jgi:hypothetical protein
MLMMRSDLLYLSDEEVLASYNAYKRKKDLKDLAELKNKKP